MVEEHYDESGYLTWSRTESGIITHLTYDRELGLVVQRVEDAQTDGVSGVPAGWMTLPGNGKNIVTDYEYDEQRRLVRSTTTGPLFLVDLTTSQDQDQTGQTW